MKFATKITLSVAIVSLIAVPILVFGTFYSARTVLQKNITKNHLEIAKHQMQAIDRALYTAYRDIQTIGKDDVLQTLLDPHGEREKGDLNVGFRELEERALFSGPWDLLTVIDGEGSILISTDKKSIGKHIEEYPTSSAVYYNAIKGGTHYSDQVLSDKTGRPTVIFAAPMRSEQGKSSINGVVLGHFAWPVILQALDDIAPPAVARLINREGMTIAAPKAYADDIFKLNLVGIKLVKKAFESGISGSAAFENDSHEDHGAVLAVSSLQNGYFGYKGSGWSLLLEVPLEKALAPVNRMASNVAALAVIVMMVLMGVLYYIGRLLARPVERLTETVEEVSCGNLTVKAEVATKDEVGELASSFNMMTETLQRTTVSKDHVDSILNTMLNTLIVINSDANIVSVNRAVLSLLGYEEKELIGKPIDIIIAKEAIFHGKGLDAFSKKGSIVNVEKSYLSKGGCEIPMLFSGSLMCDGDGKIQGFVYAATDISERKRAEEKILRQAHYDALTDLPNRFLSLDRLSQLLTEAQRNNKFVAVLFLDLDDFKKINDSLGHEMGDKLLIEAANRLRSVVRTGDTVGRLGGDEFIILIGGLEDTNDVYSLINNLLDSIRDVFIIEKRELILSASIGIAIYPNDGDNPSELLRKADSAMYHSKDLGRDTYSYFTETMNRKVSRRLALEEQMHGALERNEFRLLYQPLVEICSNRIVGAEALLRWSNPVLDEVYPDEFIPIAEKTGLIVSLGQFVLTEALGITAKWQQNCEPMFRIAVNLSPRQFRDTSLVSFIEKSLEQLRVPPASLELEITEGVLMSGHTYIDDTLTALSKLSVGIAMDDFGTGYSSLSYLRNYPFDTLKIDRSFVNGITENSADKELVHATIAMAHSLGLKVIAEGVETEEQLAYLTAQGCEFAQGYFFSKPVSSEEITEMLASQGQSLDTNKISYPN